MTYFNGGIHGRNTAKGYLPPKPTTKIYCDGCATEAIPLDAAQPKGREHWNTDFRWAPRYGGDACCHVCGVKA
jgi:hypothetical protein